MAPPDSDPNRRATLQLNDNHGKANRLRSASGPKDASGARERLLHNRASTVRVRGGGFSFRNPPRFMSMIEQTTRDAEHETAALLDHLFYHPNTPPFLARRLAQRLTTSNPSPAYVAAAAEAADAAAAAAAAAAVASWRLSLATAVM